MEINKKLLESKTVGLVVFSYKAPLTLSATFDSYRKSGFLDFFDDVCIFFIGQNKDDERVARENGARFVLCDEEEGFMGALKEMGAHVDTDYILWAEYDCKIWGRLTQAALYEQLKAALDVLERDAADLVRLRHSWLGNPSVSAAALYSYYYEVEQLASHWRNSEPLSEAPGWVKWMRRMMNPLRSKRWIGRSVYVEENPHLIYPQYIHKDGSIYIVDSEVFQWSNQPSLFSREFLLNGREKLERLKGDGRTSSSFARSINSGRWRRSHYRVGVAPGIFTWTSSVSTVRRRKS